jgi:glycosyltransferase involved in cell wall biosynthesis
MFYPSETVTKNSRFIHISASNYYQKNIYCILDAAALLVKKMPEFNLVIFGTQNESLEKYVHQLNLGQAIEFKGMCSQEILREYIQKSNALILYSRYETFGCVIIEANACGKSVIVSDLPVFHENVIDGVTGVFVESDNPGLLAEKIFSVAIGQYKFDSELIKQRAIDNYSFEKVGKQFAEFYNQFF